MVNARRVGRLGMLAVGLGVGAAVASTPGIASADTVDPFGFDFSNIAISYNGMSLIHEGSAVATTTAGTGDLAIADGAGAQAITVDGIGNFSLADGTNALAAAGGSPTAEGDLNTAVDIGNNTVLGPGAPDGAYAGAASLIGDDSATGGTGSFDNAFDFGNNTADGALSGNEGAFAGAGGLIGAGGNGNFDTAIQFGTESGENNGPAAVAGNFNTASESGTFTGNGDSGALAGFGNFDTAEFGGNNVAPGDFASAGGDYVHGNISTILGNNDTAIVTDLFGTAGSSAVAGASTTTPGDFDLANVFGDGLNAAATGGSFMSDILPSLFGGGISL